MKQPLLLGPLLFSCSMVGDESPVRHPECRFDEDCVQGLCKDGACSGCLSGDDCRQGRGCIDGACGTCVADSQCAAGMVCSQGLCAEVCASMEDCAAVLVNGAVTTGRVLTSAFGCRLHVDEYDLLSACDGPGSPYPRAESVCDPCLAASGGCAQGQACVAGECTCSSSADCPEDTVCRGGTCGNCATDAHCGCDRVCESGSCRPICTTDDDCPAGRCDPSSRRCVPCLVDADCGGDARCYADGCVVPCPVDACVLGECDSSGRCGGCARFTPGPAPVDAPAACE